MKAGNEAFAAKVQRQNIFKGRLPLFALFVSPSCGKCFSNLAKYGTAGKSRNLGISPSEPVVIEGSDFPPVFHCLTPSHVFTGSACNDTSLQLT